MRTYLYMLKWEAIDAALWRGHRLGIWEQDDGKSAIAFCQKRGCDASVTVRWKPAPNEIRIGGDAVAVNCGGVRS